MAACHRDLLRISDAELVTLAMMQALLGFASEARWLRFAGKRLRYLFPYLPGQPGYNKRLRKLAATMVWLIRMLAADTNLWADDVWVADSTPVECGRSKDTTRRSDLAGWAEYGYCPSHSRWFWGCGCTFEGQLDLERHGGHPPGVITPRPARSQRERHHLPVGSTMRREGADRAGYRVDRVRRRQPATVRPPASGTGAAASEITPHHGTTRTTSP